MACLRKELTNHLRLSCFLIFNLPPFRPSITAGTAIRESMEIIKQQKAILSGVLLSLDRQEKGKGEISAVQEIERDYGCKVYSIITMSDLITYLSEQGDMQEYLVAMKAYREQYGI